AARSGPPRRTSAASAWIASSLLENGEDVFLAHDEVLLVVQLDLRAGVLPEQDLVAGLHLEGDLLAVVTDLAVPDGDHLALLRLLLRRVGNDDSALLDLSFLQTLDQHPIVQRANLHRSPSLPCLIKAPVSTCRRRVPASQVYEA